MSPLCCGFTTCLLRTSQPFCNFCLYTIWIISIHVNNVCVHLLNAEQENKFASLTIKIDEANFLLYMVNLLRQLFTNFSVKKDRSTPMAWFRARKFCFYSFNKQPKNNLHSTFRNLDTDHSICHHPIAKLSSSYGHYGIPNKH